MRLEHGTGRWFPSVEYTWVCAAEWDTSSGSDEAPTGDCKSSLLPTTTLQYVQCLQRAAVRVGKLSQNLNQKINIYMVNLRVLRLRYLSRVTQVFLSSLVRLCICMQLMPLRMADFS